MLQKSLDRTVHLIDVLTEVYLRPDIAPEYEEELLNTIQSLTETQTALIRLMKLEKKLYEKD